MEFPLLFDDGQAVTFDNAGYSKWYREQLDLWEQLIRLGHSNSGFRSRLKTKLENLFIRDRELDQFDAIKTAFGRRELISFTTPFGKRVKDLINSKNEEAYRLLYWMVLSPTSFPHEYNEYHQNVQYGLATAAAANFGLQEMLDGYKGQLEKSERRLLSISNDFAKAVHMSEPVKNWNDKAWWHRLSSLMWFVLAMTAGAGMVALVFRLPAVDEGFVQTLEASAGIPSDGGARSAYVLHAVAANTFRRLLPLVLVAWLLRICIRNYISQSHLEIDCRERATNMQTLMFSLRSDELRLDEGSKQEVFRVAVQSVFRHSADGLVKDDGAPTFSLLPAGVTLATK